MSGSKTIGLLLFLGLIVVVHATGHYNDSHHGEDHGPGSDGKPPSHPPPPPLIYVQGYVYCQDCNGKWMKHLKHALVGVTCVVPKNGKVFKQAYTDLKGYFQIELGPVHAESCWAYAISSDDSKCSVPLKQGVNNKLTYTRTLNNIKFYSAGPFAFGPIIPLKH